MSWDTDDRQRVSGGGKADLEASFPRIADGRPGDFGFLPYPCLFPCPNSFRT